jgi:hypothetical protein
MHLFESALSALDLLGRSSVDIYPASSRTICGTTAFRREQTRGERFVTPGACVLPGFGEKAVPVPASFGREQLLRPTVCGVYTCAYMGLHRSMTMEDCRKSAQKANGGTQSQSRKDGSACPARFEDFSAQCW